MGLQFLLARESVQKNEFVSCADFNSMLDVLEGVIEMQAGITLSDIQYDGLGNKKNKLFSTNSAIIGLFEFVKSVDNNLETFIIGHDDLLKMLDLFENDYEQVKSRVQAIGVDKASMNLLQELENAEAKVTVTRSLCDEDQGNESHLR